MSSFHVPSYNLPKNGSIWGPQRVASWSSDAQASSWTAPNPGAPVKRDITLDPNQGSHPKGGPFIQPLSSTSTMTSDSDRTAVEQEHNTEHLLRSLSMTPNLDHHYTTLLRPDPQRENSGSSPQPLLPPQTRIISKPGHLNLSLDRRSIRDATPFSSVHNTNAMTTPTSEMSPFSPNLPFPPRDTFDGFTGYIESGDPRNDLRPSSLSREPEIVDARRSSTSSEMPLGLHFGANDLATAQKIHDHLRLQAEIEELQMKQERLLTLQRANGLDPSRFSQPQPQYQDFAGRPNPGHITPELLARFSLMSLIGDQSRVSQFSPSLPGGARQGPVQAPRQEFLSSQPSDRRPSLPPSALSQFIDSTNPGITSMPVGGFVQAPNKPISVDPSRALHSRDSSQSSASLSSDGELGGKEPLNFLSMLKPSSQPPYSHLVHRIARQSDQQASIFIQQKLKACGGNSPADLEERGKILDAILERPIEMMTNRFGNWAYQRCLEAPCTAEERRRIASAMRGHIVDLATNCYGTHVVQKALDCEEDIRLLIVSELLLGDPSVTLINKHASHVWSKIMELTWTPPAPPIFNYVNKSLRGRWVELATHETGSLVVQHLFENCLQEDTKDCLEEVLHGFEIVVKDHWGSFVIQHMLEHGAPECRTRAIELLCDKLPQYAIDNQAMKSIEKALKVCTEEASERLVGRLIEPGPSGRRAMLVDLALNANGSQLIIQVLQSSTAEQRKLMHNAIKKHIVTLKGNKAGSKIVWHVERTRAQDGF